MGGAPEGGGAHSGGPSEGQDPAGGGDVGRSRVPPQGHDPTGGAADQPTATGMRMRWRGASVTSTSSPRRKCAAAPVIFTWAKLPERGAAPPSQVEKCT